MPRSDRPASDSKRTNAFSSWTSPRDALFSVVAHRYAAPGKNGSRRTGRLLRMLALLGALLVHLVLFLSVTVALVHKPAALATGLATGTSLHMRFLETALVVRSLPLVSPSTDAVTVRNHPSMAGPVIRPNTLASSILTPTGRAAVPAATPGETAQFPSDHGDFGPVDRPPNTKSANDYSPALSGADSHVMTHATGNVTYHATRFDSMWAPDRENPVSKAIDRATVGSTIKLPHGIAIDCAGGPSSPGGLDTTVPVVALASAGCHGSPPPVAIDARAVLDIQMLAPATPLADSGKPPIASSSAPGDAAKDAVCLEPRVAGAPPLDCARVNSAENDTGRDPVLLPHASASPIH